MNNDSKNINKKIIEPDKKTYSAPALEKGLDILEILCKSENPLTQKEIANKIGKSVNEIYRMLACLIDRKYVYQIDENSYSITTKIFELSQVNPPTHRLLIDAIPMMQRLSTELDQSCHLTVYSQGKQVVLAKVDTPSGMGFSVRTGSELDVLVSASGRVLLAFQEEEIRKLWIEESIQRCPDQKNTQIEIILETIRKTGYESIPSIQVRGLYAISFPVLDMKGRAIAALTIPYSERIDQNHRKPIPDVTKSLGLIARNLSQRMGWGISDTLK